MSQSNRLRSGSKRRSDFTYPERPGSYHFPHISQSPEDSASPHSSQEGQTSKTVGQLPSLTAQTAISDVIGTQIETSFHVSSSSTRPRTPSPTSSTTFTLPPIALSSLRPTSYAPHSDNLHHKFGTAYPTIQTLQRENTDLASAYAQAQIYTADLNTKVEASRVENGKLAKERQRLMGKIELLEAQLEEMEQGAQQTQEHTLAKDAQYLRIVEMSTRLQNQAAAESQARKSEQRGWSFEKQRMQSVIDSLRNEVQSLRKAASYANFAELTPSPIDDYPDGIESNTDSAAKSSPHGLIAEMEALRRAKARMEDAIAGVRGDNAQLAEYIEKLGRVGKNIQMHLQRVEVARAAFEVLDVKEATMKE